MHRYRLIRRCSAAGPDGPDRFVGDRDRSKRFRLDSCKSGAELPLDDGVGLTRIALLQRFSHAEDRLKPMPDCCLNFLVDRSVLVSEILSSLRMADEDKLTAKVLQHRAGHFAGEGSFLFPVEILCTEQKKRRRPERFTYRMEGREWRGEADLNAGEVYHLLRKLANEQPGFRCGFVHFPIADDEASSH